MLRLISGIGLTQAALLAMAWAADLSGFNGRTVQDKVGGYQLFQVPELKKSFVGAFGSNRYQGLLRQLQGDGIKLVSDSELGPVIVSGQCEHHNCPNQSVLIVKLDGNVVGLCMSDNVSGDPNKAVVEWSGQGWSVKRTIEGLGCRGDTPESNLTAFKTARARTF